MIDRVTVLKDAVVFGDKTVYPPFDRREIDTLFGEYREQDITNPELNHRRVISIWDDLGVIGYRSDDEKTYNTLMFNLSAGEVSRKFTDGVFGDRIYIGKKFYKDCKWKSDIEFIHEFKTGVFELSTFIAERIDEVSDRFRDAALRVSRQFEITYVPPVPKTTRYKLGKTDEPVLTFSSFNLKLAVVQELMYNRELLAPRFDIYEFAKEYSARKIDVDSEGYEPVPEAVNWFIELPVPTSLADAIDEICMDGGSEIYHQIIPFWDGEDGFFDLGNITAEDLAQFRNLRKMTVMSAEYQKIADVLEENGIEAERL